MDVGYDLFVDKLIGQSQLFPLKNNKYNYGKNCYYASGFKDSSNTKSG